MTDSRQTITVHPENGNPFAVTITVVAIEYREELGVLGMNRGLSAQVDFVLTPDEDPDTYFLSMLVGESDWIIDSHFGHNSMPHFCHGFGARYLKVSTVVPELADVLDEAARRHDLALAIGRDVPLALVENDASAQGTE